jgi:hypothetical protein
MGEERYGNERRNGPEGEKREDAPSDREGCRKEKAIAADGEKSGDESSANEWCAKKREKGNRNER